MRFGSLFILLLVITGLTCKAQYTGYDTLNIVTYNVNNYGYPATSDCPLLLPSFKDGLLRNIMGYISPDIVGLEKMAASPASFTTDSIIQHVFDSICPGCYEHTPFTNVSGYSKENMLYYRKSKIGFAGSITIYSADNNISDINLHRLYYKSPTLAITRDTIFINIILVHLKSGQSNSDNRSSEMASVMYWLNHHISSSGNYIFMGDFNTTSSSESCYQQMVNSTNVNTRFFDPVNQPGNWEDNPGAFANYLTQSTRTSDIGDCGATGGMDDRFDFMLCTSPIMQGTDSVLYIPNTYITVGQDGQRINKSLIDTPTNTSAPTTILNGLYYMSEHLPVQMQLAIGGSNSAAGITSATPNTAYWQYNPLVGQEVQIAFTNEAQAGERHLNLYNLHGQLLKSIMANSLYISVTLTGLPNGVYLISAVENGNIVTTGKLVKTTN